MEIFRFPARKIEQPVLPSTDMYSMLAGLTGMSVRQLMEDEEFDTPEADGYGHTVDDDGKIMSIKMYDFSDERRGA